MWQQAMVRALATVLSTQILKHLHVLVLLVAVPLGLAVGSIILAILSTLTGIPFSVLLVTLIGLGVLLLVRRGRSQSNDETAHYNCPTCGR